MFASVLEIVSGAYTFIVRAAANEVRTMNDVSAVVPAGRRPVVSITSANGTVDFGQRAFSSARA